MLSGHLLPNSHHLSSRVPIPIALSDNQINHEVWTNTVAHLTLTIRCGARITTRIRPGAAHSGPAWVHPPDRREIIPAVRHQDQAVRHPARGKTCDRLSLLPEIRDDGYG